MAHVDGRGDISYDRSVKQTSARSGESIKSFRSEIAMQEQHGAFNLVQGACFLQHYDGLTGRTVQQLAALNVPRSSMISRKILQDTTDVDLRRLYARDIEPETRTIGI